MADLLTVDQFAQMLEMHPRTIRRYIRENQLKATKVGGEWRIRKEDAEMFMGSKIDELKSEAMDDIQAFMEGKDSEVEGKLQVCTVLDCYVENLEALKISEIIMRHMNQADPARGKAKFQYFFDEKEKKGRYIIWGTPAFVGKVLSAVGEAVQ
ncbi:helix-turn-helix domain-containing protein [Paenibacillus puldeungensis]|uniref:Helix-turn-helix domain-containing protein n=1 Tax=Paenibacillus puldeungensis TaxID=696536 RepID=A0ABW3RVB8_9BACL